MTASDFFEFKDRTEARLNDLEADMNRAREEIAAMRYDITRTHRVVLELQGEMRSAHKSLMFKLEQLVSNGAGAPGTAGSFSNGSGKA